MNMKNIAGILFIFLISVGFASAQECKESDGGRNYFVRGSIYGICYDCTPNVVGGNSDHCADPNNLREFYCIDPQGWIREVVNCPNGCKDGACMKEKIKSIEVTSPNGGEEWLRGNTYKITWNMEGIESVDVEYIKKGEENINHVISSNLYKGVAFYWTIPSTLPAGEYKIAVVEVVPSGGYAVSDYSNNYFTIVEEKPTCTDSDGGRDYYVKGACTSAGVYAPDICLPDSQNPSVIRLNEKYCSESGSCSNEIYICPTGYECKEGACVKKTLTCTDSDGGRNYYKKGIVQIGDKLFEDVCDISSLTGKEDGLWEHYCDDNTYGKGNHIVVKCSGGCVNGACVGTTISPTCSDPDKDDIYTKGLAKDEYGAGQGDCCVANEWDGICVDEGNYVKEGLCKSNTVVGEWTFTEKTYKCPNGCNDGACIVNKPLPPFIMAVDDKSPSSDVTLIADVALALKAKGYEEMPAGTSKIFSEVNGLMLDNKVTLAVYQGGAVIIVGEHSPASHVNFATEIHGILLKKGVTHRSMLSNEVSSANLLDLFVNLPQCTDSDGGENYYVKGYRINYNSGYFAYGKKSWDYCIYNPDFSSYGYVIDNEGKKIEECSGEKCYLIEKHCKPDLSDAHIGFKCPNGCQDGACLKEEPECISEGEKGSRFNDDKCCEGLTQIGNAFPSGDMCVAPNDGSFMCSRCGNSICGQGENKCNCMADCAANVIYTKLGQKFSLAEKQYAKVTDYNYMHIILDEIERICKTTTEPTTTTGCYYTVSVNVEMPDLCEGATCGVAGARIALEKGESKTVFGAKLTFLNSDGKYAVFVVDKALSIEGVDVEIIPNEQAINYGEKAVYTVKVTDKHPKPRCEVSGECEKLEASVYTINVRNLPFSKEYPKEIKVPSGGSASFELTISPYEIVEIKEQAQTITGKTIMETLVKNTISKPLKEQAHSLRGKGAAVSATAEEIAETEIIEEEPATIAISTTPATLSRKYEFGVTAVLKDNYQVQDTAYATLAIQPESPEPPPFPGEKVSIKLSRGWNLISLPGRLLKFDEEGLVEGQKLIGFVYIKEKQEYVTLNEAEELLGGKLREYLAKNAFWIYTSEPLTLNIWVDRGISFQDLELVKGWNLVPITEDMVGGYLTDILGDCNLEKMFLWDAEKQEWKQISLEYSFSDYQYSYGFLVKAEDYCRLSGSEILAPPEMPE